MGTEEKEGKNRKVKNVVLAIAIAALLLGAAVGSASAIDINNCGVTAGVPGGYYVLTGDLSCTADETCIIIGANGVTIDGKGHKITGNRSASDCFISIVPFETTSQTIPAKHSAIVNKYYYENVTIKDLEIKEFCSGIALKGGGVNNNTVTDCSIYDCGVFTGITHGIHMVHTNNCTICRNEIYNIEGTGHAGGCSGGGNGIFLFGEMTPSGRGWYNEFTYNDLLDNNKSGFFMKHMCMYNTISNNNATGNSEYGISPMCKKSDDNTFEHNYVAENSAGGIFMGGNRNIIRYNTVINNSGYGFTGRADGTDDNELYGNTFCGHEIADINICVECTGNHGDCNTCNTTSNYNDDGATDCTFQCGVEEGACVGATQCFTCGDTVTESCTLNGDMNCTDTTKPGLEVGASGITINGAGHMITGSETRSVCGNGVMGSTSQLNPAIHSGIVNNDDYDNVVIENLEIENFCSGITLGCVMFAENVDNNTVRNCRIHDNGNGTTGTGEVTTHGIHMVATNNCLIAENTIYNNNGTGTGCGDGGNGIFMHGHLDERGDNNKFTHNNFSYNRKSGFFTKYKCMYTNITNNTATGNGEGGITLMCKHSSYSTIEHNNASENPGDGIIIGGYDNTIRSNIVNNNGHIGISMFRSDGSYNNELYGNTVCGNGDADISTCGPECYGNHGDCNTCNTTSNYDDDGATGCTFQCGVEEGACVGATQCFTCGDTVTESCTLNGDMICSAGHGLVVGDDDIVIDGAGYKITGSKTATACEYVYEYTPEPGDCGVLVHGQLDNVTIKNLEIENFCTGIAVKGMAAAAKITNITVYNCSVHHNGIYQEYGTTNGIHMVYAAHCTINGNSIYNNTGSTDECGCGGGGNGIFMMGNCKNNNITNNKLYNNQKAGFFTKKTCTRNNITHNHAWGNGAGGIILRCMMSNYYTIEHNNASNNYGSGIYIRGSDNTLRNNIVNNNMNGSEYRVGGVYGCEEHSPTQEIAEYGVGIKSGTDVGSGHTLNGNTVCGNDAIDIEINRGGDRFTGDNNTCNTTQNYDDDGTTGCRYTCPGDTDLTITAKYEQWFGEVYNVIYTIKNLGNSTAPESTTGISIDDVLNKTDPVGLIGPGVSYIRTVGPFTMSNECDTINVCADYEDTINETNETNNCMENVFTGVVMPDLVITEKSEEWISLADKTYNITYTVKNIGNADANESTTSIRIDGTEAKTDTVGILPPQATHTAELGPFTMSDESDTIRICADNESVVEESNEDNNCLQNTFEHPGVPDLVITRKYEEWVASNDTWRNYTITYTVKNVGTGDAGASITAIIIDDVEVATDPVGALDEGDSYTNTLGPFTMPDPDESDTIKVCADKNNDVEESNEDNNCTENTFEYSTIGCLADDNTLFRCGNTVTKNCTFNGDMSCPSTHGLKLGANSITINGNNTVLDGAGCTLGAMSRSGIYNQGYDDVTIEHLEVKSFCHGMYLNNVYRKTIERCDIHHNGNASTTAGLFGITMKYVYNSTIRNNTVHHQIAGVDPNPGCEDGGNGMFLYKGNYNNITENDVYNNTKGGIFIKMQPMHNNISHNELWDNGQGGIILRCMMSNYNTIEHNNASNNYGSGMFIGARYNTIRYNRICDNRDGGPYYQDSVGGHGYGINLGRSDGSYDNYLHDNEICGNVYKDIYVVSGVTGNHGVNNTCDTTYNYDDDGSTSCTYSCVQQGVCGNVDGLPGVTTNDGRQIFMYLLYGEEQYPIHDLWAADCDGLCDGITTNDGRQIFMNLLYGEEDYPLACC